MKETLPAFAKNTHDHLPESMSSPMWRESDFGNVIGWVGYVASLRSVLIAVT